MNRNTVEGTLIKYVLIFFFETLVEMFCKMRMNGNVRYVEHPYSNLEKQ